MAHLTVSWATAPMTENEITYEIRGAVYDVYKELGPGLLESVYEEALCFELEQRGLTVERQVQVPIKYKGNVLKTELRLDLIVENQVIVELKSVEEMKKVFSKQLLTYLRLMNKKVGLLVNFKTDDILTSIKRMVNGHTEIIDTAERVYNEDMKVYFR